jgi:hypothetical protein
MDGQEPERGYYFEIAKQITTLDKAALLIFLAVDRELPLSSVPAGFLIISLVGAFLSMIRTGTRGISPKILSYDNLFMTLAVIGFLGGVVLATLAALGLR